MLSKLTNPKYKIVLAGSNFSLQAKLLGRYLETANISYLGSPVFL